LCYEDGVAEGNPCGRYWNMVHADYLMSFGYSSDIGLYKNNFVVGYKHQKVIIFKKTVSASGKSRIEFSHMFKNYPITIESP
jgi:alpha-N-acetylglucosamine transferase